jgi:hypothetical protein
MARNERWQARTQFVRAAITVLDRPSANELRLIPDAEQSSSHLTLRFHATTRNRRGNLKMELAH